MVFFILGFLVCRRRGLRDMVEGVCNISYFSQHIIAIVLNDT